MEYFLFAIKQQVNILSFIILITAIAFLARCYHKKKLANILFAISLLVFYASATQYLPRQLAMRLEKNYLPLDTGMIKDSDAKYYIHVLGSGVNLDKRLPANSQLGPAALGRLAEAIRIQRMLTNSIIVGSANSMIGLETQASVTKRAAILLGVEESRVERLDKPSTTKEEAIALRQQYGNKIKLIIVSDAMHLPRAMKLFQNEGFHPIASPTNFKVPSGPKEIGFGWWPSLINMNLMDLVLHEYLGRIKAGI